MNAKQIAAASTLALAGIAAAQTVPAEAWVGPPIASTGSTLSRAEVGMETRRAFATPQAPQDAWIGAAADMRSPIGAATRSEVAADFNLYRRAGLAGYQASEAYDPYSARGRQHIAEYQRLRSGPAYTRELARLQGGAAQAANAAAAQPDSNDY